MVDTVDELSIYLVSNNFYKSVKSVTQLFYFETGRRPLK